MKTCLALITVFYLFNQPIECKADDFIREEGYCMWYGQCGINPLTNQPINCLYNNPAKPVDSQISHKILAELCPEFAHPDSKVCCDQAQIVSLQSGMRSAEQMMSRCPACWKNFRELYCRMTCSPNNSLFIDPLTFSVNKSILSIDFYVEKAFRDGLYNSCKDVIFPSTGAKIMNFLCGTTVDYCNPLKFLDFMGDPELNGVSSFLVKYPTEIKPGIKPLSVTAKSCDESVWEPFINTTMPPCSCEDCPKSCIGPRPIKIDYLTAKIIFSLKPSSHLNIRTCYRNFFTAPDDCVLTGTILRHGILNKVLEFQAHVRNMSAGSEHNSLEDFCLKASGSSSDNCTVISVLQYWQNDAKKLNDCIPVFGKSCAQGMPVKAAWGDHLAVCLRNPQAMDDTTALHLSCLSTYGEPVVPRQVLGGYDDEKFSDASLLFVIFAIKKNLSDAETEQAKAWEKKVVEYLKIYSDTDLQIAYVPINFLGEEQPGSESYVRPVTITF